MNSQDVLGLILIGIIIFAIFSDWGLNHKDKPGDTTTREDKHG